MNKEYYKVILRCCLQGRTSEGNISSSTATAAILLIPSFKALTVIITNDRTDMIAIARTNTVTRQKILLYEVLSALEAAVPASSFTDSSIGVSMSVCTCPAE